MDEELRSGAFERQMLSAASKSRGDIDYRHVPNMDHVSVTKPQAQYPSRVLLQQGPTLTARLYLPRVLDRTALTTE